MLTIRKQNFDSQLCYCCVGHKANIVDSKSSVTCQLYHQLPNGSISARIIVPRCRHCADKMNPIFPIGIVGGIMGGIGSFFYIFSTNGVLFSLLGGLFWAVLIAFILVVVMTYSFSFVYKQDSTDYEIAKILRSQYGWQTEPSKESDKNAPVTTELRVNQMLQTLVEDHGCEYGDF